MKGQGLWQRGAARLAALAAVCVAMAAFGAGSASAEVTLATDDQGSGVNIVGGNTTTIEQWPWTVALYERTSPNSSSFGFICGGSVLSQWTILTAAHCAEGASASNLLVVAGITDRTNANGHQIAVRAVTINPSYNFGDPPDHDVALLDLKTPTSQTPIAVASPTQTALWAAGQNATVIGWGATSYGGPASLVLREVTVPIISDATCGSPADYDTDFNPATMVCAGEDLAGGKDSCQGDSGGPMVVDNGAGGWVLAGTVSWGDQCALPHKPGVYGRIGEYGPGSLGEWIAAEMAKDRSAPPTPPEPTPTPAPPSTKPIESPACQAAKKLVTKREKSVTKARKRYRHATTVTSRKRYAKKLKSAKSALKRAKRLATTSCLAR